MPLSSLNQKTVVVTGASSGTGRAIALQFARKGANLVLAARRAEALKDVATICEELGAKAITVVCDVTDATAVKNVAGQAVAVFGSVDVWVNNAGVLAAGLFEETPIEIHDQVIRTNLMGYIHGAHAAVPYFKKQGSGVLINNISVGGWFPTPYAAGYSASKWGLRGFSDALRGELYKYPDIHICDMFPAFLDTPGIQHAANYTGRYLKPAPPVYDPQKVAVAAVQLPLSPKDSLAVGVVSLLLKAAHGFLPSLSRTATAFSIESYLKAAHPLPATPGNVFEPVTFGTGIHGGWNSPADAQKRRKTGMLILSGLALGWLLLAKKR